MNHEHRPRMSARRAMVGGAAVLWLALVTGAAGGARAAEVEAVAEARYDLELGFTVRGRVSDVAVQAGDAVKAGQKLVTLDDREGAAQLALFEMRAASTLDVDAAEATWKLAENEVRRVSEAAARAGAAAFEVERATLEATRARLTYELAKQRRMELALQTDQARLMHERYTLAAPMGGVIEEVAVSVGELVEEVRPVLRLVVTNPLRASAPVPVVDAAEIEVGAAAWVRFRSSGRVVEGKVSSVAAVADPGSETRAVTIEMPNDAGEPAGSHVVVSFTPMGRGE